MNEDQLLQAISKMLEANTAVIDRRLSTIEDHLAVVDNHLSTIDDHLAVVDDRLSAIEQTQADQQKQITKLEFTLENTVVPRLDLLFEGHQTLLHQLEGRAEKERLQEAESNIHLHADAIRQTNQDVQELKADVVKIKVDIADLKQA